MISLFQDGPAAAHSAQLEQFGRLAGLWTTHITYHPADGSPNLHVTGAWEFGYALDGRAVIDTSGRYQAATLWPGSRGLRIRNAACASESGILACNSGVSPSTARPAAI
jgi:hypothetical protein